MPNSFLQPARGLALALLITAMAACSQTSSTMYPDETARPALDVPERFEKVEETADPAFEAEHGPLCYSPMIDPRDGRRLRLVRSASDRGDYEVPTGSYGVEQGQYLRLECSTGRVIGIVGHR
jgi:hypothetical protein